MRRIISLLPLLVAVLGCVFSGCSSDPNNAASAACGNGQLDTGEACDDGNKDDGDGCSSTCTKEGDANPNCGNGKIDPGETCDDGNREDGDGCPSTCNDGLANCGDGKLDPGEACDDGNKVDGDGCEKNCTKTVPVTEIVCQTLSPLPNGMFCSVDANDAGRVIVGTVLTPDKIYRGGQVVADASGNIVFVGCKADCDADPACSAAAATATSITCPNGVISPGLINTHDHITYAQNSPYTDKGERYEHRQEWRKGQNGHQEIPAPGNATADQVRWGELRFLFGGAVSTVGSGGQTGLLRNLDKSNMFEGLAGQKAVNFDVFPLRDSSGKPIKPTSCSEYSGPVQASDIANEDAYLPHVAEGIDARAEMEFVCLGPDNPKSNVLIDKSAFIHGVGLTAKDYSAMSENGTSLIWSPRSNITLYGQTAAVTVAARTGVNIALGTDWMPTGSMNLLRELRCADSFNKNHLGSFFTDYDLWMMVTANAASATAVDDVIGTLAKGKVADIAIFDGSKHTDYRAVIDAEPKDVLLVLRGGKALYGDELVLSAMPDTSTCDVFDMCGATKKVCLKSEIGKSFPDLKTSLGNIYAAFFCGAPDNEPSCSPKRPASVSGSTIYTGQITPDDKDGDGIPDANDDCPTVFNPIRPVDNGKQADFDGDGLGDVCDPCPLDANTTQCSGSNPNDADGDGVPNATDNCPAVKNPDQKDTDGDGKGDACDPCPNAFNPGAAACPGTIYQVKDGTIPAGSTVALTNQLVTGRTSAGFFLQIKPGDPDYDTNKGASYSGVYVFASSNTVKVGDRVTLTTATVANFFGQIQLTSATVNVVTSNDEAPPAPTVVTPAEVATNGAKATALEGVIVQVNDVTVTNIAPPVGSGDTAPTNEFVVDSSLRVNDFLYLITPFPTVSQEFSYLRGILDYRNNDSKLELRSEGDVGFGAPVLVGFGPSQSYTDEGQAGTPTFPSPLTVEVAPAPTSDTFIAIASSDPASLTVVGDGVTIPAGQTSAPVLVNGIVQSANVTLTATLGVVSKTANVRVIGVGEQPSVASLTPATASVPPGGMTTLTVRLDIPAPAGGAVVDLTVTPANAGTLPATVTVPANQLTATFDYVDGNTVTSAMVTAMLGASTASSTISTTNAGTCTATDILISEIRTRGPAPGGGNDDFVELYNPTNAPVTLDNTWKLEARSDSAGSYQVRWTGTGKVIPAHGHFLIVGTGYTQSPAKDESLNSGISDSSSVVLKHSTAVVDAVCLAVSASAKQTLAGAGYTCEGTILDNHSTNIDASVERKPGGTAGNCMDTGNNGADFITSTPANPQNSASPPTP